MAQSGHCELHCTCPLLGVKRTSLLRSECPLLTQSEHRACKRTHSWQEIAAGIDATEEAVKQRKGV